MAAEIILPKNKGVKSAYEAILKRVYIDQKDIYPFQGYVNIVVEDCGVCVDTAKNYCKQLDSLGCLKYLNSTLAGHFYKVCVFVKNSGEISYINEFAEVSKLIEARFGDVVESEFLKIKKMNILQDKDPWMGFDETEIELAFKTQELAQPIKTEKDEVIKSSFVTIKRNAIPVEIGVSSNALDLEEDTR